MFGEALSLQSPAYVISIPSNSNVTKPPNASPASCAIGCACLLIAPVPTSPQLCLSLLFFSTLLAPIFLPYKNTVIASANNFYCPPHCSEKGSFVAELSKLLSILSQSRTALSLSFSLKASQASLLPREAVSLLVGEGPRLVACTASCFLPSD